MSGENALKKLEFPPARYQEIAEDADPDQQKHIWLRQENEPLLWFNRFNRFKRLGAKRTLLAALLDERASLQVLQGTDEEQEPPVKVLRRRTKKGMSLLQSKPTPTQVPGSWKRASIQFRWVERAQAWDAHLIELSIEHHMGQLLDGAAVGIFRVEMLKNLLQSVTDDYNRTSKGHERIALAARIQSILGQIEHEMASIQTPLATIALRHQVEATYNSMDAEALRAWKESGAAYSPPGREFAAFK